MQSWGCLRKISMKGSDKHPLYRYLAEQTQSLGDVEWNFQKYLVDRSGKIVSRYHHRMNPLVPEIVQDAERVLAAR
jgi:glutathione peroxidase